MKKFTFLMAFLMFFNVMAKSQHVLSDFEQQKPVLMSADEFIDLEFVWCDFEGQYTNVDGFRETINSNTVATDLPEAGVNGSTAIQLDYNVTPDVPTTGYQMWSYPNMIDVSAYNYLVLNIKADIMIDSVYLILIDNVSAAPEGNSQRAFSIGGDWEQIFLPLDSFVVQTGYENPADLTILHLIQILFIYDVVSENPVSVYIDAIGFTSTAVNVSEPEVNDMAISVFPNPATNLINVIAEKGSQISLINMSGSIINSKIAESGTTRFSFSDLQRGIYFVRVINNNSSITRKVLVY